MTSDLQNRAEAIARLEEQKTEIAEDIKAAYAAAASAGYTAKALKRAIKIHGMTSDKRAKHDAEQADLFLYLDELEFLYLDELEGKKPHLREVA